MAKKRYKKRQHSPTVTAKRLAEQKRKELDAAEAERVAGIKRMVNEQRRERLAAAKLKKQKRQKSVKG